LGVSTCSKVGLLPGVDQLAETLLVLADPGVSVYKTTIRTAAQSSKKISPPTFGADLPGALSPSPLNEWLRAGIAGQPQVIRKEQVMKPRLRLPLSLLLGLSSMFGFVLSTNALAQQKYKIEEKAEWSTSKYVQQLAIDVGDMPGHKVRVYEIHWIYNDQSQLAISGVKVKENWSRGYSDYTNGKGRSWGYTVWELADGNKIYMDFSGTTMAEPTVTGSIKGSYHGVSRITGGTGKFSRIRGMTTEADDFDNDPKTGYNKAESQGEYWFED
jgi:hypothetical protein